VSTEREELAKVAGFTAGRRALEQLVTAGRLDDQEANGIVLAVLAVAAPHIKAECLADLADDTDQLAADNPQHAEPIGRVARLLDGIGEQIRKALNT